MSTVKAYRIVKQKRAETAFDGEGAKLYGGRWNSLGVGCVYAASTASLAQLEMLVHLNKSALLINYVIFEIAIPSDLIEPFPIERLPENWAEYPSPVEAAKIGDAWLSDPVSKLALALPSSVNQLLSEKNYLLNPNHPMFEAVTSEAVMHKMQFDGRLKD